MVNIQSRIEKYGLVNKDSAIAIVALVFFVGVLPSIVTPTTATQILVLIIFASGYNILLGYAGEMSFGHAMFFGGATYVMLISMHELGLGTYVALLFAIVVVTLFGVVVGWLSLHKRGVYFAMITIAFGQMVFFVARAVNDLTGGSNGLFLPLNASTSLFGFNPAASVPTFYMVVLLIMFLVLLAIRRIIQSPFGRALQAVKKNEERAAHLGYNTDRLLLGAFTFSALFSALAGTLYALLFQFVSPNVLYWSQSGEVLLMTIIGGVGTIIGPAIGAVVFGLLDSTLSDFTRNWPLVFGLIFIVIVEFAPDGLYDLFSRFYTWLSTRYRDTSTSS